MKYFSTIVVVVIWSLFPPCHYHIVIITRCFYYCYWYYYYHCFCQLTNKKYNTAAGTDSTKWFSPSILPCTVVGHNQDQLWNCFWTQVWKLESREEAVVKTETPLHVSTTSTIPRLQNSRDTLQNFGIFFALELKNMPFAKFTPAPVINVDHSLRHYGDFVSGQHCAEGKGCLTWDRDIRKFAKNGFISFATDCI